MKARVKGQLARVPGAMAVARLTIETIRVCRRSRSLSEAGRTLFKASRSRRASANDADRLRKYLQRYGIEWAALRERG